LAAESVQRNERCDCEEPARGKIAHAADEQLQRVGNNQRLEKNPLHIASRCREPLLRADFANTAHGLARVDQQDHDSDYTEFGDQLGRGGAAIEQAQVAAARLHGDLFRNFADGPGDAELLKTNPEAVCLPKVEDGVFPALQKHESRDVRGIGSQVEAVGVVGEIQDERDGGRAQHHGADERAPQQKRCQQQDADNHGEALQKRTERKGSREQGKLLGAPGHGDPKQQRR